VIVALGHPGLGPGLRVESYIRREIVPVIGGIELAKLKPGHVRAVLTQRQRRGIASAFSYQPSPSIGTGRTDASSTGADMA
jgi:hypothetical protein